MTETTTSETLCKIFIVDDDEQQALLMQEMAKTAQLETIVYCSSTGFLATAISKNDIVVLDLQMPGKDGIEIMRELAAQNITPHFILISGFDERVLHSAKQLAESKNLHVIATINKPIKAKNFITLLKNTYETYQPRDIHQYNVNTATTMTTPVTRSEDALSIEELKLAIRQHQLIVHLQPKINFNNKQLKGAEVLVRWQHPSRGLIYPDKFIPLAEEHYLMNLLTEEILRIAIKECHKLSEHGLNIKISINLSAQNINDLSMPEKLEALLNSNNIAPEQLVLEITEIALMNEISDSLDILNRLRMKGFSLSIDDFGTGYSSLVKLYQAPFSELKIDQHFVKRMAQDEAALAIVRICILLAKELKIQTVAEAVETEAVWLQLKEMGCNMAQGYFIAKPMPVEEFIHWVNDWEKN